MRFYRGFPEAIDEIRRELKEMGIGVKTKSVQNLDLSDRPEYDSFEIQNYTYTVTQPNIYQIPLRNPLWAHAEFSERVSGKPLNPGKAWERRSEYWKQFLNKNGEFDYSYPDRMAFELPAVLGLLRKDLNTRRAFLPIYNSELDDQGDLTKRLPCSIGYWFNFRQGKLNMTYLQRSSDFGEHFNYDIFLAASLKDWMAEQLLVPSGMFTHWIGSLHVFAKDVEGVF